MSVAGYGVRIPSSVEGSYAGFVARGNGTGEGIGWFAAKRVNIRTGVR